MERRRSARPSGCPVALAVLVTVSIAGIVLLVMLSMRPPHFQAPNALNGSWRVTMSHDMIDGISDTVELDLSSQTTVDPSLEILHVNTSSVQGGSALQIGPYVFSDDVLYFSRIASRGTSWSATGHCGDDICSLLLHRSQLLFTVIPKDSQGAAVQVLLEQSKSAWSDGPLVRQKLRYVVGIFLIVAILKIFSVRLTPKREQKVPILSRRRI